MTPITPEQFVEKWGRANLKERAAYQEHFLDLCRMLGHPTPGEYDPSGQEFTFEYRVEKVGGGRGFVDVWFDGHFAIEYKGAYKYQTLDDAYNQLLQYREGMRNPPLLVVTDILRWEIHTNWPSTEKRVYRFSNKEIELSENRRLLRALFFDPASLHPGRTTEEVTREAAARFDVVAQELRARGVPPERIASFVTRLVFTFFAEDADLLPIGAGGRPLLTELLDQLYDQPAEMFVKYTGELFQAMAEGGDMGYKKLRYFDGSLFDLDRPETLRVEALGPAALEELRSASHLNWASIDPSIFGTLFERILDPAKRAQLGAHYTSKDDILLIVEPVLMQPLHREWAAIQAEAAPLRAVYESASSTRARQEAAASLQALRDRMLARLRAVRVLDPACGSGNFLYVALQLLLDLEKAVINSPLWNGLPREEPQVHPRQLYGIEINEIAHDLASSVVWIGYLQWHRTNGFRAALDRDPLLEKYDNIRLMDAILGVGEDGALYDPAWPEADVIVSNPPFLGAKKMISELGENYVGQLRSLFKDRLWGFTDLVTYWFERARDQIAAGKTKRSGLLATNSIRDGGNRAVLERIKNTGNIFMAWSDREWILEGAAVRVSMVGFDDGSENQRFLDGSPVTDIFPNLSADIDLTRAMSLTENKGISFIGTQKGGPFDIDSDLAQFMLSTAPESYRVISPWINASDVTGRSRKRWVINFGDMSIEEAREYFEPFNYVIENVKPSRINNRDARSKEYWWQFQRPRPALYEALGNKERFIVTPLTSKHRFFVWILANVVPENLLVAITRDDDYFFGVLHSRLHEVWALRLGTWLGKGNDPRYTPTTTFETFPFPWPPGQEDTSHPAYAAISAAAQALHTEREAWLNPPGVTGKALERRTLTNLYNALNVFTGVETMKVTAEAGDFAPRLAELHDALDRAVCDAYGWPHDILADEEAMLRRLLALNLARTSPPPR